MAHQQWENEAKDRFVALLKTQRRGEWSESAEEVPVDHRNNNYDYELTSNGQTPIALEIFRLVEDENELAEERTWAQVANLIAAELRKRDVKGYTIQTPRFHVQ